MSYKNKLKWQGDNKTNEVTIIDYRWDNKTTCKFIDDHTGLLYR